jgi:triosephosphate isomerase
MQKLIIANWKSNKSPAQAAEWIDAVSKTGKGLSGSVMPIVAPAFPLLSTISESITKLGWALAVQDLSPFSAGSYTGAVSAANVQGLGVKYVILGHSERRRYFQETPQVVAQKVDQALQAGLKPVVCVDEQTVEAQATALTAGLSEKCVVAYEPAGAIGTGNNASLEQVKDFKATAHRLFGSVPFLYGGSVDELNISEYLLITDGALIGTASLDAKQFITLLQSARGNSQAAV